MSYEKQGFASGDVLYATQLNAMDDQIADNEEEITGLKSALNDVENAMSWIPIDIQLNKSIDINTTTPMMPSSIKTEYNWCCCCIPCESGDAFTITGTGGVLARLWAFADSDGLIISGEIASSGESRTDFIKIAPENAAYFAFNSRMSVTHSVIKGVKPDKRMSDVEDAITGLDQDVIDLQNLTSDYDTIKDLTVIMATVTDDIGATLLWTDGFTTLSGTPRSSDSYHYTERIPVSPGDIISSSKNMRYVTAYAGETAIVSKGEENVTSHIVQEGIDGIVVSIPINSTSLTHTYSVLKNALDPRMTTVEAKIESMTTLSGTVVQATADTVASGEKIVVCSNIDNKKGDTILFYANVDQATFGSITVGHGDNISYGASVTIDGTNVTTAYGTTANYYSAPHNLVIDKFIFVEVTHTDNARAQIRIITASGSFEVPSSAVAWGGCKGEVFAKSTGSSLTNVKVSCTFSDFKQDIFLFGDSYLSLGDLKRYPTLLVNNGYTNIMLDGYGGRSSAAAIISFRNVIALVKPKYLIWALGMNDPDTSTGINTSYKTCIDEVIATCEQLGITLILATIPTVSTSGTVTRNHEYKNAYIHQLHDNDNYRFVDFASAVGAGADGVWYDGMLELAENGVTERVHPTELGAKALYSRFLIDVPEIANR